MSSTQQFLEQCEAFVARHKMAETVFGDAACGNGKLLQRLRNGGSVSLETADRVRDFMRTYKPARQTEAA